MVGRVWWPSSGLRDDALPVDSGVDGDLPGLDDAVAPTVVPEVPTGLDMEPSDAALRVFTNSLTRFAGDQGPAVAAQGTTSNGSDSDSSYTSASSLSSSSSQTTCTRAAQQRHSTTHASRVLHMGSTLQR